MKTRGTRSYFGATSALALAVGMFASPAFAQGAPPAAAQKSNELEEIVVTATRREESLQKVPITVTAISESQLEVANVNDLKQLGSLAPALTFKQGGNDSITSFYLRGVGTYLTNQGVDPSVGVAVDGVSVARASSIFNTGLKDIERVEVLEGPQGTLFGKNTSAGLVSVTTRKPVLGLQEFSGSVSYGNFDDKRVDFTANAPINDNAAVRAAFWHRSTDGFVDVVVDGTELGAQNSWGARLGYKYQPNDRLTVNLIGEWSGSDSDPFTYTMRYFSPTPNATGRLVQNYENSFGIVPSPTNLKSTSQTRGPHSDTYSQAYTALVDYDVGGMTLSSVSAYRKFHYHSFGGSGATGSPDYNELGQYSDDWTEQLSQELRLTSPSEARLRYVVGVLAYYMRLDGSFLYKTAITGSAPISAFSRFPITNRSYAAFGEATFDVTDRLHLIAGGRITRDSNSASVNRTFFGPPPAVLVAGSTTPGSIGGVFATSAQIKDTQPSWRLGAQFEATDDIMAYATVSRGYKVGSLDFNFGTTATSIAANGGVTKPEKTTNYEIGIKSKVLDGAVTFNLTAYREVVKDFQVSLRQQSGLLYTTVTSNAPEIESKGVESQIAARLSDELSVSANLAYIDATFTDFPAAPCYAGEPTVPAGTAPARNTCVGGLFQSLTGAQLPNAPKWNAALMARYSHDLSGDRKVFANAAYRYRSKANFSTVLLPRAEQSGYGVADLQVGYGAQDGRWAIKGYVNNVFDKSYVTLINDQISASYLVQARSLESFRLFGVELSIKY